MLEQQLLNGLTLGSTYALVALGFTLVFGILGMINFAHGEIFMLGAYIAFLLVTFGKLNIVWAFLGAMVGTAILGMIIERVSFRPLRKVSVLAPPDQHDRAFHFPAQPGPDPLRRRVHPLSFRDQN